MSALATVLDALHYTGPRGRDSYQVCCPIHDDNTASLSIKLENDKILVFCHACGKSATPRILESVGLNVQDLFLTNGDKPRPGGTRAPKARIVATYDYQDAGGALLFQAVRKDPKSFTQRRPDGNGGWVWSVRGVDTVLYRLPELLAADPARPVFLVEGEKDADRLAGMGIIATTCPMGAGKWKPSYSETLAGRKVYILPDNDRPGREHAETVARQLTDLAAQVKIIDLPGLPSKGDVSDWLDAGGTLEGLRELVDATPEYSPSVEDAGPPEDSSDEQSKSEMLLEALENLGYTFKLNRLEDTIEIDGARMDDITEAGLNLKMIDQGFSRPDIADAYKVLAGRNAYDPVVDYLIGLQWDGRNHMKALTDHLTGDGTMVTYGARQFPLHAALMGRWLAGAVARGLHRGQSAFNHQTPMLVLIGPQGIGKSSVVRWLASGIGYEYHRESMVNPHSIEDQRSMVTKWIWEVSELASSLRRGDRDSLKSFITQEMHTYRKPWSKHQITKPTLCNFVGTLNPETGFLDDPTGHRRFLPVAIHAINHAYAQVIDVNQLWAQVVHLYQAGKLSPELDSAEREALRDVYTQHEIENPLATYMQMYFDIDAGNPLLRCHTATIIQRLQAFSVSLPTNAKVAGREINDVLAPLGLVGAQFRLDGVKGRGWLGIAPNGKIPPNKYAPGTDAP